MKMWFDARHEAVLGQAPPFQGEVEMFWSWLADLIEISGNNLRLVNSETAWWMEEWWSHACLDCHHRYLHYLSE